MSDSDSRPGVQYTSLSVRIVRNVAQADGIGPVDLEPPLYETFDPMLDRLVRGSPGVDEISFEYRSHAVTVRPEGTIELLTNQAQTPAR